MLFKTTAPLLKQLHVKSSTTFAWLGGSQMISGGSF
jgi:hypothetical protein